MILFAPEGLYERIVDRPRRGRRGRHARRGDGRRRPDRVGNRHRLALDGADRGDPRPPRRPSAEAPGRPCAPRARGLAGQGVRELVSALAPPAVQRAASPRVRRGREALRRRARARRRLVDDLARRGRRARRPQRLREVDPDRHPLRRPDADRGEVASTDAGSTGSTRTSSRISASHEPIRFPSPSSR